MIQRPLVARQEAEVGLDVLHHQLAWGLIGFGDGPNQSPLAQPERVNLKLKPGKGGVVEAQLHLCKRQMPAERLVGPPEADVLRHDAAIPTQAQAGELEIEAPRPKVFQQRLLGEVRKADLIEINKAAEQDENQQPNGDAEPAEADSSSPPKLAFLARPYINLEHGGSRIGRHGKEALRVNVKPGRAFENPRSPVQSDKRIGHIAGCLTAEFHGNLVATLQFERDLEVVIGEAKAGAVWRSVSNPGGSRELAEPAHRLLHRQVVGDARSKRPVVRSVPDDLTHSALLPEGRARQVVRREVPNPALTHLDRKST